MALLVWWSMDNNKIGEGASSVSLYVFNKHTFLVSYSHVKGHIHRSGLLFTCTKVTFSPVVLASSTLVYFKLIHLYLVQDF